MKERPGLAEQAGAYPRHNRLVRASFDTVMECSKPVIAAINGAAIGAGCVLALCCDILIATDEAPAATEVDERVSSLWEAAAMLDQPLRR